MQRLKKSLLTSLSVLLAVSLLLAGCGSGEEGADDSENPTGQGEPLPTDSKKVVAEYEGGKVTEGELNRYINLMVFFQPQLAMMAQSPEAKEELVKQHIAEKEISNKVKDNKKHEKEADEAIKQFEKSVKEQPEQEGQEKQDPDKILKDSGITKDDLRNFLIQNNKVTEYLESQVKEKDLKKEYEESDAYLNIDLNHVLISTQEDEEGKERSDKEAKKRAEEVKKKLEDGGKWKEIAEKYSDDPGSKDNSGKYEGTPDQWVPEFSEAALKQPLKEIGDPVKTDYGYHVIRVNKREKLPFDEVKEEIKGTKVRESFQTFIDEEVKLTKLEIPGAEKQDKDQKDDEKDKE
ncbi:peptidylprolyl isomerase [Desmospora profundinema]|uniref:Foldase protein PrsA n=1 Tax=Desmospora profundinema TaxID=1571184 RepID=A0ABU1IQP4_9BACL|nr:peptidylprolyl isomerase [Desmospora profundinema]MDR6227104.1 foldase protein PrsA [Desmospora profundinema]